MAEIEPPYILSSFILAELDYLFTVRIGSEAEHRFLEQVADGVFELPPWGSSDVAAGLEVLRRYDDLGCGLADASVVVLAERYGTDSILTLDERHFRVLTPRNGVPFRLLPADA